jgi:predicted acetyltransferase
MIIKQIDPKDYDRVQEVSTYCFSWMHQIQDKLKLYLEKYVKPEYTLGLYDDGKLMSHIVTFPYYIYIQGKSFSMGGIGLVASMPEVRHSGQILNLLKESLKIMRERGQYLSMLGPFSYEFYRKAGYEIAFQKLEYEIPIDYLKTFKSFYKIKVITVSDIPVMEGLYEEFGKSHNGCTIRDEMQWSNFILDHPWNDEFKIHSYLCKDENDIKGYIIFKIKNDEMIISEMMYSDLLALDTLLRFIYSHESQVKKVRYSSTLDDKIQYIMPNPNVPRKISSGMMFRVVDVREALRLRKYEVENDLVIKINVIDKCAPWNESPFELSIKNGCALVSECCDYDISCDIQTFSQIFIGYINAMDNFYLNRIQGSTEAILKMDKIFKKSITFNNNGF